MSLRIFYHPYYSSLTLPERHRFPLAKYQALYQMLATQGYPLAEAPAASRQQITRVHDADYVGRPLPAPWMTAPSADSAFPGHPC